MGLEEWAFVGIILMIILYLGIFAGAFLFGMVKTMIEEEPVSDPQWYRIDPNPTVSFLSIDEDRIIHVIRTGHNDRYIVVHEDAYGHNTGEVEFGTRSEIQQKYRIML